MTLEGVVAAIALQDVRTPVIDYDGAHNGDLIASLIPVSPEGVPEPDDPAWGTVRLLGVCCCCYWRKKGGGGAFVACALTKRARGRLPAPVEGMLLRASFGVVEKNARACEQPI